MNKNVYIVLTHTKSLVRGSTTKWEVIEKCEFVDNVKRRHAERASVILDYTNSTIVKDRDGTGVFDEFMTYVDGAYPQQMQEIRREFPIRHESKANA